MSLVVPMKCQVLGGESKVEYEGHLIKIFDAQPEHGLEARCIIVQEGTQELRMVEFYNVVITTPMAVTYG